MNKILKEINKNHKRKRKQNYSHKTQGLINKRI